MIFILDHKALLEKILLLLLDCDWLNFDGLRLRRLRRVWSYHGLLHLPGAGAELQQSVGAADEDPPLPGLGVGVCVVRGALLPQPRQQLGGLLLVQHDGNTRGHPDGD